MAICDFYPRPPRGGRPRRGRKQPQRGAISIHALREEGDRLRSVLPLRFFYFYPRPPRGGRPGEQASTRTSQHISIHALREEGDDAPEVVQILLQISIHALREEGDLSGEITPKCSLNFYPRPPRGGRLGVHAVSLFSPIFLSTPSARRATWQTSANKLFSIKFLSTPSARRATRSRQCLRIATFISIHALREEGDAVRRDNPKVFPQFLSTPSARRATAKTETKSLFSNKLYNILHEFRRALIYNGSKSYPNHAK